MQTLNTLGISLSRFASSGGFLPKGNVTLLVGVDEEPVEETVEPIPVSCRERTRYLTPMPPMFEPWEMFTPFAVEVQVGGPTIFVHDVEQLEKL